MKGRPMKQGSGMDLDGISYKLFEACLKEGVSPTQWKKAKLVLLTYPCQPSGNPVSYNLPIMLDILRKVLERVAYIIGGNRKWQRSIRAPVG